MLRLLGSRSTAACRLFRASQHAITRSYFFGSKFPLTSVIRNIDRQLNDIERQFDRIWWNARDWFNDFRPIDMGMHHPSLFESYRLQNPIVEENGVKVFLLQFDVHRFKPEEVIVKTNTNDNTLTVEANHEDAYSKFQFCRKVDLPKGVVAKEVTCRFNSNGVLEIRAPYNAPESSVSTDTEIPVKHE